MSGPNSVLGFVTAAAQVGLEGVLVKPKRGIYPNQYSTAPLLKPILAQAIVEETCSDRVEVVSHPVETGSPISDHAYCLPQEVTLRYAWSNSASVGGLFAGLVAGITQTANVLSSALAGNNQDQMSAIYQQFVQLKQNLVLFDIYTGKRYYKNMLVVNLEMENDNKNENALFLTIECKQIIFATSQIVTLDVSNPSVQANPAATAAPLAQGQLSLIPAPTPQATVNQFVGH